MLSYLSAILHGPVSLACTCSAGVSAHVRTLGRLLDVVAIHTCGGVHRHVLCQTCLRRDSVRSV